MSYGTCRGRGQILVIFAGGLLALLAIGALVIDIGFVFWIQRQERSAADPGALAAARYIRFPTGGDTGKMFQAACFYARQNGFFEAATTNTNGAAGCVAANDERQSNLVIHYPPSRNAGDFAGRPGFVEVAITRPHQSFLAGIFGLGTIQVSSSAVAAFSNGDSNSNSMIALRAGACSTLQMNGNSDIQIVPVNPGTPGGYIMVNSECAGSTDTSPNQCTGSGQGALDLGGTGDLIAPHAFVVGRCKQSGNSTFVGGVTEGASYYADPLGGLIGPSASGTGAFCQPLNRNLVPGDGGCEYKTEGPFTLSPGIYYGGIKVSTKKPVLDLTPGIYIMAGGGFNPSNGEVDSSAGDIMIYSTDVAQYHGPNCQATAPNANYCQGDIHINGQAKISLQGLDVDPCPPISDTGCPYVGILFWQDGTASKALSASPARIIINGGSDLQLSGTVYNPKGEVQVNGGSATTGCTGANQNCAAIQVIADTIKINGGSGLKMPYDPSKLYHLNNKGLVH